MKTYEIRQLEDQFDVPGLDGNVASKDTRNQKVIVTVEDDECPVCQGEVDGESIIGMCPYGAVAYMVAKDVYTGKEVVKKISGIGVGNLCITISKEKAVLELAKSKVS
jgi:hypothetical protein